LDQELFIIDSRQM